jgi:hypothetical protein
VNLPADRTLTLAQLLQKRAGALQVAGRESVATVHRSRCSTRPQGVGKRL